MTIEDSFAALNSCPYLFLVSYEEAPDFLDLRVIVHEARAEKELTPVKTGNVKLDQLLKSAHAIKSEPSFREFTITFQNYVGFSVRNESYVCAEPEEEYSKNLRAYSESKFLEFIQGSTFAQKLQDEPILHFAVVCTDHIIDVACAAPPHIELRTIGDRR
ncbi:MAG: hypothetical protein AAFP17_05255 [Pseudomonadota bacterium]